jgi:hypothetical protein
MNITPHALDSRGGKPNKNRSADFAEVTGRSWPASLGSFPVASFQYPVVARAARIRDVSRVEEEEGKAGLQGKWIKRRGGGRLRGWGVREWTAAPIRCLVSVAARGGCSFPIPTAKGDHGSIE